MADLNLFSELDLDELKVFAQNIRWGYPAISRIGLYRFAGPNYKYVLLIEAQDSDPREYRAVFDAYEMENVYLFRDIKGTPDFIREHENNWWVEVKNIKVDFPLKLAIENSGYELYNCNNSTTSTNKKRIATDVSERIQHFCNDALKLKYIDDFRLSQVFENDNQYEKLLPKLWDRYQLNKRGPKYPKVETVNDRIVSWNRLIARLTKGLVAGTTDSLEPIEYLKMYRFNRKTGDFERSIDHGTHLNLNELKEYFINQLEIPLPLMLFPPIEKTEKKNNNLIYQFTENPEEDFPNLYIHILSKHAHRWVKEFSEEPISRILLCSFSSKWEKHFNSSSPIPVIYAVVFEVDADDKTVEMSGKEREEYRHAKVIGERSLYSGERLQDATGKYKIVPDKVPNLNFITADFVRVYKQTPIKNFRKEWGFRVKFNNSELNENIRTDEPCVVLWDKNQLHIKKIVTDPENSSKTDPDYQMIINRESEEYKQQQIKHKNEKPFQEDSNCQYLFIKTGPTWKIVYDGHFLEGLKGKGFAYIEYLVSHPHKDFHVTDLSVEVDKENPQLTDEVARMEYNKENEAKKVDSPSMDKNEIIDQKADVKFKEENQRLKRELAEAQRNNDPYRVEKLQEELDDFIETSKQYYGIGGKKRKFRDPSEKTKDKIAKSIQRAINHLKKYDELAGNHFQSALSPINSFKISYHPDRKINWQSN